MNYKIISAVNQKLPYALNEVSEKVSKLMQQDGWEVHGPLCVSEPSIAYAYFTVWQPLIKKN
ncbi:MAG: hypothetical protein IKV94_02320 [Clostridia bacterium]|nr:hypothetical protein [Clostridia bacterium]